MESNSKQRINFAGLLVTLGIIYGDIGTSPLYVLKAIVGKESINSVLVLGGISCIFWTLTLQTTFKYVLLTLRADNKGEGGIFSLYALVRHTKTKWLVWPAMIGGAALLADGIITPPISISSSIEGLRVFNEDIPTVPIVIAILIALFVIQQFGTNFVGKFFGPMMLLWFSMIAVLGISQLASYPEVLKALNPVYAYELLVKYPGGFWLLGAVFLCTTGAEALYSDLGHCGRKNIQITWVFAKTALVLNYFGQGAWLMKHDGSRLEGMNPFYEIMPDWWLIPGIIIATAAAIVASQALISGSFTLINEAIRLNFWPKVRVVYPTDLRGQLYVPSINWLLLIGCIGIVLFFRESSGMEAAYGLAIIITMLSTTTLLTFWLYMNKVKLPVIALMLSLFLTIEISFLVANLDKFPHGGWLTVLVASAIVTLMWAWYKARKIKNKFTEFVKLKEYIPLIRDLSHDFSIPKYATHLVYLTRADYSDQIEAKIIYSILQRQPKRADIYWLVHVDVQDEPYTLEYKVTEILKGDIIRIDFKIGFRIEPRINLFFRKVVEDMVKNLEVDISSRYESLGNRKMIGDFRFIVMERFLAYENDLAFYDKIIMDIHFLLKRISLSEPRAFGLDTSSVTVEQVPMVIRPVNEITLKRVKND
ncbi:MAG: KUP/HAK/KT family potassium transporter [Bacteroidia bacterium]|nr:KUP/HAK/KT family potassium transporter [Bacteroidia bacterium]